MKTVLVTGANGFVGTHLVKEFLKNKVQVVAIGGKLTVSELPSEATHLTLDLMDKKQVQTIDFRSIDGVVNLAGLAAAGPSFDKPLEYIYTNMGIQTNLFEAALAQNAKPRFVIISSAALYDPNITPPLVESSAVTPISPYAVSKIGQEQLGHYYKQRGFQCVIARPFNHIGPGQGLGFIVPDITQQVLECERGISSEVLVGNLDARRDYTDVRDIARAYRLLLEKGENGEVYNICSGKAWSGHDILKGILDVTHTNPKIKYDKDKIRPSDNPLLYGSYQKLNDTTGWQPEIPFETTIADVVADWRSRS